MPWRRDFKFTIGITRGEISGIDRNRTFVLRKWLVNLLITSKSDCREENIHHHLINYKQRSMKELDLNSMLHINRKYILSTM